MPRKLQLESLQNEYASIVDLLNEAESINDTVGKLQLAQRKKELETEIQSLLEAKVSEASVAMYFRGDPVIGSRGISVEFAGKTLSVFQEMVTRQFAKTQLGVLGERGPIPMKDETTLMLTGIAQGSFGFLLEEISEQPHLLDTALKETIDQVVHIINAAGALEDTDFNNVAEDLDPRTLIALKDFFTELDTNKATLRLVNDANDSSLDGNAIHIGRVRTEATQIEEKDETITGILSGFLSRHRKFELTIDTGAIMYGSTTQESTEKFISAINSGKKLIGGRCTIKVTSRIVRSLNRPDRIVYRLLDFISLGDTGDIKL